MFGRRSRARMQSGVEGRVRSVRMLNNRASRQQVTDKLTRNTTDSTHDCSNSCKSNMRPKSCSRARMSGVEGRVRSVKMLNDNVSHQQVTDKTTNTTNSTRNSSQSNMRPKSCSARATKMTTTSAKK